jgi:hypothetical protein
MAKRILGTFFLTNEELDSLEAVDVWMFRPESTKEKIVFDCGITKASLDCDGHMHFYYGPVLPHQLIVFSKIIERMKK